MTKNTDKAKGLWSLNPIERAEEMRTPRSTLKNWPWPDRIIGKDVEQNTLDKLDNAVDALMAVRQAYQDLFEVMPVAWQTFDNIVQEAIEQSGRESVTGFDGRLQIAVQQHSPLPWHVEPAADGYKSGITAANGDAVIWISEQHEEGFKNPTDADAKLIVASVNHADKLAEAIAKIRKAIDSGLDLTPSIYGAIATLKAYESEVQQ